MKLRLIILMLLCASMASAQLNINNYIVAGQTKIQASNYVGAIEDFNIVIKFKPQLPEPYFYRGMAKHQLEDFRGAISDYNNAIEIKPYYPEAFINRGLAYLELQEYEKTIADYNRALELSPRNAGVYNNRGIAKISMKDFDGAIADYNKALEFNPNFVNALINRSNAYIAKGDTRNAIKDLNQAIVIRPHYASAYLLRGLARFELEDYASALRDFDQTLKLDPQNAYAYNNRGIVKQKLEDYEGAIMDYDLALQLNPTMPNAYYNRGIAKEILKRSDSEEDFLIAAKLDPSFEVSKQPTEEEQYLAYLQQQQQQQQTSNAGTTTGAQQQNTQQTAPEQNDQQTKSEQQIAEDEEAEKARRRFRLSLADTRNIPTNDTEDVNDGLVQNKNVIIDLQDIFITTSFTDNSVYYEKLQYYSSILESLNQFNNYIPVLNLSNKESYDTDGKFQNNILYFNEKINVNKVSENYLSRGIFNILTNNYNSAISDFNEAIKLDIKGTLAYFNRGNCRVKMVELVESVPDYSENLTIPLNSTGSAQTDKSQSLNDYQYILDDYNKCIESNPSFPFVYYNKAYILCKMGRYEDALSEFDIAIKLQNDFAEAYFNRGLTKIYLDDVDGGAHDLSKAGELGIKEAYNIIKRYCN